jgi:hypothetical protein
LFISTFLLILVLFLRALRIIEASPVALFLLHLHRSQLLVQRLEELALVSLAVCLLSRVDKLGVGHLHQVHEDSLKFTFVHILQVVSVVHDVVAAVALLVGHCCQRLTQLVEIGRLLLVMVVVLVVLVAATASLLVLVFAAAAAPLVLLATSVVFIILVLATALILPTLI